MEEISDLVIVGAGPAGLAAAIYAVRAGINMVLLEKELISGGQIVNTYEVDNYPGIPMISGYDLASKMRGHLEGLGGTVIKGEVQCIQKDDNVIMLQLKNGQELRTKTVVLAMGANARKLGIPGEEELLGSGVSYCATCDGAFFKGRTVAVVGGGETAVSDAIFLARVCKKVYVIHRRNSFRAASILTEKLKSFDNVEVLWNSKLESIQGKNRVEGITISQEQLFGIKTLQVDGVFIAIGTIPNSSLVKDIIEMDENGYIVAGEDGITSMEGVFAAGDIRTKQLRQVVTAVSDGANVIRTVEKYIN